EGDRGARGDPRDSCTDELAHLDDDGDHVNFAVLLLGGEVERLGRGQIRGLRIVIADDDFIAFGHLPLPFRLTICRPSRVAAWRALPHITASSVPTRHPELAERLLH